MGPAHSLARLETAEWLPGGTLKFMVSQFTPRPGHSEVMGPDSFGDTLEQGENSILPSYRERREAFLPPHSHIPSHCSQAAV